MNYSGNSTAGADQGMDISDDESDGWECDECGHVFWVASASSVEDIDGTIIGGCECPNCGAFVETGE